MTALSIIAVAGNITRPSRTAALLSAVLAEVCSLTGGHSRLIELVDIGADMFATIAPERLRAFDREGLSKNTRSVVEAIEGADALVVGTPVYKASYSGAFKHLFDLVRPDALTGKPVLLTATARNPLHGLVIEHQLRPLFGFFNASSLPAGIFALESEFRDYRIEEPDLSARVKRAAAALAELLNARSERQRAQPERATA